MAYSALPAKVASDTLTLTNYNAIKGNFEAGVPDIFTAKGDLAAATGANAAARLAVGADDAVLVADSSQAAGMAWQIQPAARVYHNASQTPTPSTWTTLAFNSERYDTDGAHDNATANSRLTVPAGGAGLYLIGANLKFDIVGGWADDFGGQLVLNGATVIAEAVGVASQTFDHVVNLNTVYALAVGDYVEVKARTIANSVTANGNYSPEFWFHWLRRQ